MTANHKCLRAARSLAAALVGLLLASPAAGQRGAITRPRNLPQLVEQAAVILRGHVISARVEPHPELIHLSTVVVSMRVRETLKGQAGSTFTFRQYIWDIRDRYESGGYKKGQELVLLMNAPTRYGLSSPAGLEQGRFRILRDSEGREMAINGYGNAGLFRDLGAQLARKGMRLSPRLSTLTSQDRARPVPLEDLRVLIRQLAEVR